MVFASETPQEDIRSVAGDTASEPQKKGPGRPRGARNKIARDSLKLLSEGGPAVVRRVLRMATGRPVLGAPDPDTRKRHRVYPTIDQQQSAQRLVLAKLVPDLKNAEVTTDNTNRVVVDDPDPRALASAILHTLNEANPGAVVTVLPKGTGVATFTDPDMAKLFNAAATDPEIRRLVSEAATGGSDRGCSPRDSHSPADAISGHGRSPTAGGAENDSTAISESARG